MKTEKQESKSQTKILCLLDVLGFENLFNSKGLVGTFDIYKKLIEFVRKQTGGLEIVPVPIGNGQIAPAVGWLTIENAYFSDSILFWSDYRNISFNSFCQLCSEAICYSLELGLTVRGSITIGDAILDTENGYFLGSPLIEAARVEKVQKWIGISFGPSVTKPPYSQNIILNGLLGFKSHYKKDSGVYATGMVLDWPRKWRETRPNDLDAVVNSLNTDHQFSDYFDNTLRFIKFSTDNHDWFTKKDHLDFG
jgi:hypothetical protein